MVWILENAHLWCYGLVSADIENKTARELRAIALKHLLNGKMLGNRACSYSRVNTVTHKTDAMFSFFPMFIVYLIN